MTSAGQHKIDKYILDAFELGFCKNQNRHIDIMEVSATLMYYQ